MITFLMYNKMIKSKTRNPHLNKREYENYQKYLETLSSELQEDFSDSS